MGVIAEAMVIQPTSHPTKTDIDAGKMKTGREVSWPERGLVGERE